MENCQKSLFFSPLIFPSSICEYGIITVSLCHIQIQLWVFNSKDKKSYHPLNEWAIYSGVSRISATITPKRERHMKVTVSIRFHSHMLPFHQVRVNIGFTENSIFYNMTLHKNYFIWYSTEGTLYLRNAGVHYKADVIYLGTTSYSSRLLISLTLFIIIQIRMFQKAVNILLFTTSCSSP